jgi:hypothetical protein
MPSHHLLSIFNPSNYWRGGHFTIPWQPIQEEFQILPEELVLSDLRDLSHTPLNAQVDRIDPEDSSRDTLVFSLPKVIPPGSEDEVLASTFVRLDRGKSVSSGFVEPSLEIVCGASGQVRGARLSNNRLVIWFNLIPAPKDNSQNWFSGSATSVQLDYQELLDPLRLAKGEWSGQDPEKRCMQIDRLLLPEEFHSASQYNNVSLCDRLWRLVSHSSGLVRASITIASEPFDYIHADPTTGSKQHLTCELYRVISLYAGANYLVEELYVKGKPRERDWVSERQVIYPDFAARYFAHMNMGRTEDIQQVFPVFDWFAIGSSEPPYPAYGLMTNVHLNFLTHPYLGHKSHFSWQLLPSNYVKCVHLFMRGQPEGFDARVGHLWYELIHKPLRAEIYQDASCPIVVKLPNFTLL